MEILIKQQIVQTPLLFRNYYKAIERYFGKGTRNNHVFSVGTIRLDEKKNLKKEFIREVKEQARNIIARTDKSEKQYKSMKQMVNYLNKYA